MLGRFSLRSEKNGVFYVLYLMDENRKPQLVGTLLLDFLLEFLGLGV